MVSSLVLWVKVVILARDKIVDLNIGSMLSILFILGTSRDLVTEAECCFHLIREKMELS